MFHNKNNWKYNKDSFMRRFSLQKQWKMLQKYVCGPFFIMKKERHCIMSDVRQPAARHPTHPTQISDFRFQISNFRLQIAASSQPASHPPYSSDIRIQTSDGQPAVSQPAIHRTQISDFRFQIRDFRFHNANQQFASQPPTELRFQTSDLRFRISNPTHLPNSNFRFQITNFQSTASRPPSHQS